MTRQWAGLVLVLTSCAVVAGMFLLPSTAGLEATFNRLFGLAFAVVGFLACGAQQGRRMGWLCLAIGATAVGFDVLLGYAETMGPGAAWTAWGGNVLSQAQPVLAAVLLPALFPTGEVIDARWRWLPPTALVVLALMMASTAGDPGSVEIARGVHRPNPFPLLVPATVHDALFLVAAGAGAVCVPAAMLSLVLRFRRSRGVERQQLRWLVSGLVAAVATMVVILSGFLLGLEDGPAVDAAFGLVSLALPAAIGVALTRHGLYDLDRVVSRTVAYALVGAVVAATYLGSVVVLGGVARQWAGESGDLVVALSTLTVAAMARPLLARVRDVVDRRFDRARYDATRTIDAFGRTLRDEVSLDTTVDQLRRTAARTFLPQSAGVVLVAAASAETGEP